jgi:sugar/nucleoside kinase (ribokinase family)
VSAGEAPVEVVCLGILVADVLVRPVDAVPPWGSLELVDEVALRGGGCALNTSSVLVRLGLPAAAVGKVGSDPFGDFILRLLDERGVERRGVLRDGTAPTSATVGLVSADGERTFLHLSGANGRLAPGELDPELLYRGRWLHVAGALVLEELDGEPLAAILAEARRRGVRTSLDTVFDATGRWARLVPALPHLDLAVPSLEEARAVSGETEPARVAAWFRSRGVSMVALTEGPRGCYVAGGGFEGEVAAPPADVLDGTGAGDAFAAGVIRGLIAGWDLERSARFGCAAGALATTAVGAFEGVGDFDTTLALAERASDDDQALATDTDRKVTR